MHLPLPKLDFSQEMCVVFTASPSTIDVPVAKFNLPITNATKISILRGTDKIQLEVDLDHSLDSLRTLIFEAVSFHPANQILKFGGKILANYGDSLKSFGIAQDSIIEVGFKLQGNLVPSTYADKFYYKDIKHTR